MADIIDTVVEAIQARKRGAGRPPKPVPVNSQDGSREDDRVPIRLSSDLGEMGDAAVGVLAQRGRTIYRRGGSLVFEIADDRGRPMLRQMPKALLRETISRLARFERYDARCRQWLPVPPPEHVAEAVLQRGHWPGIRTVAGVANSPCLRQDGTVLAASGFDAASGLLGAFDASLYPAIPEAPTRQDAERAAADLLELVQFFPWVDQAGQSAWLGLVLTMVCRRAIDGPTPLFLIDANKRGTGKSKLARMAAFIALGSEPPLLEYKHEGDEVSKSITAHILAGSRAILMDNVSGPFGLACLDAAITLREWQGRILGKSEMSMALPIDAAWIATSNNADLKADLGRRTVPIRLETELEHPEDRTGLPDSEGQARAGHPRYLAAALTIARAWFAAGKPAGSPQVLGSFESWAITIQGMLAWAGQPSPLVGRKEKIESSDTEADSAASLMAGWTEADHGNMGMTVSEALRRADGNSFIYATLRDAIKEISPQGSARVVGAYLKRIRKTPISGKYFDYKVLNGNRLWYVREVKRKKASGFSDNSNSLTLHTVELSENRLNTLNDTYVEGRGEKTPKATEPLSSEIPDQEVL